MTGESSHIGRGMVRFEPIEDEPEESLDIIDCFDFDKIERMSDLVASLNAVIAEYGDLPIVKRDDGDVDADMKSAQKFIGMTRAEVQREFFDSRPCAKTQNGEIK